MLSPGINSKPVANNRMRVRWSELKFNDVSENGSHRNVTESNAIARFVFISVSNVGGEVLLGEIVKFDGEMLKKILPEASTLTRAEEVGRFGTMIVAAPIFGAFETSVKGKLLPPSTESNTRTFAQLMG